MLSAVHDDLCKLVIDRMHYFILYLIFWVRVWKNIKNTIKYVEFCITSNALTVEIWIFPPLEYLQFLSEALEILYKVSNCPNLIYVWSIIAEFHKYKW